MNSVQGKNQFSTAKQLEARFILLHENNIGVFL
jgi:hypothetical protein